MSEDPSYDVPAELPAFDGDEALTRALKRVVRTAVGDRVGTVAVARIAAGLVQVVSVLRDEAATLVLTRPADLRDDDVTQLLDEVVTVDELRAALARRGETVVDAQTHGVNLARRLLGKFHAERCPRPGRTTTTQMVARFELGEFTERMNDLAAIEREARP